MMRGKPGYEHLNEPLHILVEAELPVEIIDARLMQAREILEDLLKPMVRSFWDRIYLGYNLGDLIELTDIISSSHNYIFRKNLMTSIRSNSYGN